MSAANRWFRRSTNWRTRTQLLVAGAVILVVASVTGAIIGSPTPESASPPLGPVPAAVGEASSTSTDAATSSAPEDTTSPTPATPPLTAAPTATTSTPPAPAPTTPPVTTASPTPGGALDALAILATIPVESEHRGGYNRDLFAVWSDLDGDGCDTRAEVLITESLTPAQVDPSGCGVIAGDWFSAYDGLTFANPGELDIDHVVALKEAWDSGAWQWSVDRRVAYGNDTTDPRTLIAVSATSNRTKGDKDPSNWLPQEPDVCRFIGDWVAIKARWSLTMDESEHGRIRNLLNGPCAGTTIVPWPATAP